MGSRLAIAPTIPFVSSYNMGYTSRRLAIEGDVQQYSPLLGLAQIGLVIVIAILLGLGIGIWLDSQLGSRPLFTLVLSLVGSVAGSVAVYRMVMGTFRQVEKAGHKRATPAASQEEIKTDKEDSAD